VILAVMGWAIGVRNSLVAQKEGINNAWAEVENQMQRRFDLIPNLVKTVKGYAAHEKGVFKDIADARAKLAGASTVTDKVAASNALEGALSRLLVVVEDYPTLKADTQFTRLMDELAGAENRMSVARMRYNDIVRSYNTKVKWFPSNLIAKRFGFTAAPYLEAAAKAKAGAPSVEF
jgi:LemA protein